MVITTNFTGIGADFFSVSGLHALNQIALKEIMRNFINLELDIGVPIYQKIFIKIKINFVGLIVRFKKATKHCDSGV
jgi:hypothetical protein